MFLKLLPPQKIKKGKNIVAKEEKQLYCNLFHVSQDPTCRNPTLRECEDETHTPEMRTWESTRILETSEFDCGGQNTSHLGVIYIIGKLSKHRCRKWARMSHLDIYNTSYGKKKGRESN
jgi:hypothetical protein